MEKPPNAPRSLTLSIHLYAALLNLYPSKFRRDYGGPMLQLFRDCARRALREDGAAGLVSLWGRMTLDAVRTALEEHAQRGVDMSKEKFIKLSGWALMLGGLAVMIGWLAGTRPEYNRFNAASQPIDRYANAVEFPLIVMGLFMLSVGFVGLLLRYGRSASGFGRACLWMGILSGAVSTVGAAGLGMTDSDPWWSMFFLGMIFQYLGLALFGLSNLRRPALPRWNWLPLLAGIWVPLFVMVSLIAEQVRGEWVEMSELFFISLWLLSLAGLAGLGYLMQSDAQPSSKATLAA